MSIPQTPTFARSVGSYFIAHYLSSSSPSNQPWQHPKWWNMGMDSSDARFIALDPILLTTKNKFSWRVLYVAGVQGSSHIYFNNFCSHGILRCRAPRNNLDEDALDRTREFNEALFEETDTDTMWTEYGIVGDLVVIYFSVEESGHSPLFSHLRMTFPVPTYINWSPRTSCINSSRVASRITWSTGFVHISRLITRKRMRIGFWTTLIVGMAVHFYIDYHPQADSVIALR